MHRLPSSRSIFEDVAHEVGAVYGAEWGHVEAALGVPQGTRRRALGCASAWKGWRCSWRFPGRVLSAGHGQLHASGKRDGVVGDARLVHEALTYLENHGPEVVEQAALNALKRLFPDLE